MDHDFRRICLQCLRAQKTCICHLFRPFDHPIRFVVLQHPRETRKKISTGRLSNLLLKNGQLVVGPEFANEPQINQLLQSPDHSPYLLYPTHQALDLSQQTPQSWRHHCGDKRQAVIFVVDGTWSQANKMVRINPQLRGIPQIKIRPQTPSHYRIRPQPHPKCLSTIESIYWVLEHFDRNGIHPCPERHHLMEMFKSWIDIQIEVIKERRHCGYRSQNPAILSAKEKTYRVNARRQRKLDQVFKD